VGAATIILGIVILLLFVPSRAVPDAPVISASPVCNASELISGDDARAQLPPPEQKQVLDSSSPTSELPQNPHGTRTE
jgi:hypothetical protein